MKYDEEIGQNDAVSIAKVKFIFLSVIYANSSEVLLNAMKYR